MSVLCAVLCCLFSIAFLLVFAPRPFPNVNSIIALDTASLPASFFLSFLSAYLPTYYSCTVLLFSLLSQLVCISATVLNVVAQL